MLLEKGIKFSFYVTFGDMGKLNNKTIKMHETVNVVNCGPAKFFPILELKYICKLLT